MRILLATILGALLSVSSVAQAELVAKKRSRCDRLLLTWGDAHASSIELTPASGAVLRLFVHSEKGTLLAAKVLRPAGEDTVDVVVIPFAPVLRYEGCRDAVDEDKDAPHILIEYYPASEFFP
jgi:hypothetical protein